MKHLPIIANINNTLGQPLFAHIARIAKGILCISHSSASVERIFSSLTLNKTNMRNRMKLETVSAILETKNLLKASNSNCFNYIIPKNININEKNSGTDISDSDSVRTN